MVDLHDFTKALYDYTVQKFKSIFLSPRFTVLGRKVGLEVGENQSRMGNHYHNVTQKVNTMVFPEDRQDISLQDKLKRLTKVPTEKHL